MKELVCILIITLFIAPQLTAIQQTNNAQDEIELNSKKLQSPDFNQRYDSIIYFYGLKDLPPEVRSKINNLFFAEIEKKRIFDRLAANPGMIEEKVPKDLLYINSEKYGLYFLYLSRLAAKSKDTKLLPYLLDYCVDYEALSQYDNLAIEKISEKIYSSPDKKIGYIEVLGSFFENKKTQTNSPEAEKIINVLKNILTSKDENWVVKVSAINTLVKTEDGTVIQTLEKVAATDPCTIEIEIQSKDKSSPPKKEIKYPVREEARRALEKLKTIKR